MSATWDPQALGVSFEEGPAVSAEGEDDGARAAARSTGPMCPPHRKSMAVRYRM
ncbi:hypothetical protein [Streptomyces iconiensis]|uniref:Uncharacterized protein n=1 Tax=Streptomyces iconiensis TaxID=1384038 RepID=A0ABT7A0K4_9ACTN|nr:hypothetical protein [Streptomyces iconiensis]MDJ1134158.1 hypothetical protein [Streptomyces iconiensis]